MVTGGAYTLEKYEKKGTSVFKADPNFYGPKSEVDAIALVYFTNEDAMLADLKSGKVDWVDEVPIAAATTLPRRHGIAVPRSRAPRPPTSPGTPTRRRRRTASCSTRR